jgi:hypothetical protein
MRAIVLGAVAAATLLSGSAIARKPVEPPKLESNEIILFSHTGFSGGQYAIYGPTQHIVVPFKIGSVAIPDGTHWELCSGNTFSGCREITKSEPAIVASVRSARPVAPVLTSTPTTAGEAPLSDAHLRGIASEFFVTPAQGGHRIAVPEATAEAMTRSAEEFCRSAGWRSSFYARLQKVGGATYLADVLCADVAPGGEQH